MFQIKSNQIKRLYFKRVVVNIDDPVALYKINKRYKNIKL